VIKTLTEQTFGLLLKNKAKTKNFVVCFVPSSFNQQFNYFKVLEDCSETLRKTNFYTLEVPLESELTKKYLIREVPTLYVFDEKGDTVAYTLGNYSLDYLINFLRPSV